MEFTSVEQYFNFISIDNFSISASIVLVYLIPFFNVDTSLLRNFRLSNEIRRFNISSAFSSVTFVSIVHS